MSTQAYLVIALILAVLLDLGLLLWTRRNLEKRGITADDKRAVYLFNRYSPILTWLNYTTLSILEIRNKSLKLPKLFVKKSGAGLRDSQPENKFPNSNFHLEPAKLANKPARVHLRFQISTNERIQITVESSTYDHLDDDLVPEDTNYPDTSIPVLIGSNVSGRLNSDSSFSHVDDGVIRNKNKELFRVFSFFTEHWLVTDFIIVFLAVVPVFLIVMDRWLEKPMFIQALNEHWNKIASPLGLVYPAYFLIIVPSLITAFLLFLVRKEELFDVENQDLQQDKQNHSMVSTPRHHRCTKILLYGSGICLILALLAGIRLNVVAGWWFLLTIFMYIIAWLLRSVSIQGIFDYLTKNGAIILSYTVFCLALLYFLAAIHLNWNFRWLYLLTTIFLFVNALRYFRRIHPILWFVPLFMILYTFRINGWEFSVIGDEYSFYDYAKSLVTERSLGYIGSHIFDGQAVFGSHPFFSSFLQAIPMKLFGVNNFSWRISNILFISASIPLFFYFFRAFTSQFIAMATSLFIGFSHYLMTFGKIGYNNLQALFVLALVLSVSAWTVKTRSRNRYLLLGLSLGICFYVYPVAIYVLGTWLIFMLFFNPPNNKVALKNWLVMGGMFLIIISPLFVQSDYWRTKVAGTIFYSPHLIENVNTISKHVLNNLLYSFFSFLYLAEEAHFVTVSYVDPLTALLTILGILSSLIWMRKNRFIAFICGSFGVMLLFVGVSHDRYYPPTTRMFMLLPWFAFFASIGLRWMYNLLMRITDRPINPKIFLSVAFVAVVMLNLYQAYSLTLHRMTRYQSPEMLFLRLVQKMSSTPGADSSTTKFMFLTDGKWGIDGYRKMQEVYAIPDSFMELDSYIVAEDVWPSPIVNTIQNQNTLVIVYANMDQDLLNETTMNLSALQKISCPIAALDGSIRFYLWYSSQMQWVCEDI